MKNAPVLNPALVHTLHSSMDVITSASLAVSLPVVMGGVSLQ